MKELAHAANFFRKSKADALALASYGSPNGNFLYFSGTVLDNSLFIARRDGERTLLVNKINASEAERVRGLEILVFKDKVDFWKKAAESLFGCKSVALDMDELKAKTYAEIGKRISGKKLIDGSKTMLDIRAIKEEEEIESIKKSAQIARRIINKLPIEAGKTELELARALRIGAIENGAVPSFEPIVLSGANTSMPHGKPSGKKLQRSDVILVDFGVRHGLYCSDITRCFFTGQCREERQRYGDLKGVFEDTIKGLEPGMRGAAVQERCDRLMSEARFGKMIHSPGHGIGIDVHECPSLSRKSKDKLANGMTIAVEPAFYGKYGLRYEDDVVIGRGKARVL